MGVRRVSVIVAEDHPLYREALADAIRAHQGLDLKGEATGGDQALDLIQRLHPDVALLDVRMDLEGPAVLDRVKADGLGTRVVFLSAYLDSSLIYSSIRKGASGFLSKGADRSAICEALIRVAEGETVLSPETQTALGEEIRSPRRGDEPVLTPRELEVLGLAAEGMSAGQIGAQLFLSPATIKTHLAHLYEKLGVSDRAAAVAEAFRRGLLQ